MTNTGVDRLARDWEMFGRTDPLWAVNTEVWTKGCRWDEAEFFETGRVEVAEVLQLAQPPAGGRCLDFGCGVGRLTIPLAEHFAEVVGVDIAPSMLEQAKRYSKDLDNISYVLNQAEDLASFADGSFDFVNASIVFQHMPPVLIVGYLREFARILSPGGMAAFTLPSEPAATFRGRAYRWLPKPLIYWFKRRRDGAVMQMNGVRISDLIRELEAAGLHVDRVRSSDNAGPNWVTYRYVAVKPQTVTGRV